MDSWILLERSLLTAPAVSRLAKWILTRSWVHLSTLRIFLVATQPERTGAELSNLRIRPYRQPLYSRSRLMQAGMAGLSNLTQPQLAARDGSNFRLSHRASVDNRLLPPIRGALVLVV